MGKTPFDLTLTWPYTRTNWGQSQQKPIRTGKLANMCPAGMKDKEEERKAAHTEAKKARDELEAQVSPTGRPVVRPLVCWAGAFLRSIVQATLMLKAKKKPAPKRPKTTDAASSSANPDTHARGRVFLSDYSDSDSD